jgi:CAAX prenyl protease-like protein
MAYPARVIAATLVWWWCARRLVGWRLSSPWGSVLVGVAVFGVWIAPDLIWPGYRGSWLFSNSILGEARSGAPAGLRGDVLFLVVRTAGSTLLVPLVEEVFWRGWLMRWLISPRFEEVPLGAYTALAFWLTALLFASEHGSYWDVGLAAGLIYNGWMVRTRSLSDCILAHAVTNGCLGAYVLLAGRWEYWL